MFDIDTFSQLETTEAGQTASIPIPLKDGGYKAIVTKLSRIFLFVDKDTNAPTDHGVLDVVWKITDGESLPEIKAVTNRDENFVKQSVGIDFRLDKEGRPVGIDNGVNKSLELGQLRAALDQNDPGKPWRPAMMLGQVARILIKHRPDKNNPEIVYSEVKSVVSL